MGYKVDCFVTLLGNSNFVVCVLISMCRFNDNNNFIPNTIQSWIDKLARKRKTAAICLLSIICYSASDIQRPIFKLLIFLFELYILGVAR